MEQNYVFMTDSDSDLPFHLKEQYDIPVVYMPYALNGKEYFDDLGQMLDHKSYFDMMRQGATPVTSALNEETYLEYFEPILKEKDLLFVAFSSKLSCTIQAVYSAREKLLRKYPDRKFTVVDTLRISAAAGFRPRQPLSARCWTSSPSLWKRRTALWSRGTRSAVGKRPWLSSLTR